MWVWHFAVFTFQADAEKQILENKRLVLLSKYTFNQPNRKRDQNQTKGYNKYKSGPASFFSMQICKSSAIMKSNSEHQDPRKSR